MRSFVSGHWTLVFLFFTVAICVSVLFVTEMAQMLPTTGRRHKKTLLTVIDHPTLPLVVGKNNFLSECQTVSCETDILFGIASGQEPLRDTPWTVIG